MKTQEIIINGANDTAEIKAVAEILRNGGIAAIPTETVYGLAANALDEDAVKKIFIAKGRPQDNPLIVHIANIKDLEILCKDIPEGAYKLAEKYWPGPLTMILPKTDKIPSLVSAGLDTVAIRYPVDKVAGAIIKETGLPLAAPSANLSGSPSPTTAEHCIADLTGRVDAIVVSHDCEVGVDSTVITLATPIPRLLRPGAITLEQLEEVLGKVDVDKAVLSEPEKDKPVASPGMKYKHYAPKTKVILVESAKEKYIEFVNSKKGEGVFALCFEEDKKDLEVPSISYGSEKDELSLANGIFSALRKLDESGAKIAYAHSPKRTGVELAVYNRLIRAAAFETIIL